MFMKQKKKLVDRSKNIIILLVYQQVMAKLFNDAGFLYTHYVPFDKRNMCFGDNPIEIKVY